MLRQAGRDDLASSLDQIKLNVTNWWSNNNLWWYTDHGPDHSERVADYCARIASAKDLSAGSALTPIEWYLLMAAAWVHDVGMQVVGSDMGPTELDQVRARHPRVARTLIETDKFSLGLPQSETIARETVALLAESHGTQYYLKAVEQLAAIGAIDNEDVRPERLAPILLIGDELDLHYRRVGTLPGGATLAAESKVHWLKHESVQSVELKIDELGRICVSVGFISRPNLSLADRAQIQMQVTAKLLKQFALTDEILSLGFKGELVFSRKIDSRWRESPIESKWADSRVLRLIAAENSAANLVNHSDCLRQVETSVQAGRAVRIVGTLGAEGQDEVGREDLLFAVSAKLESSGFCVFQSRLAGAAPFRLTASDVLETLYRSIGGQVTSSTFEESERREELAKVVRDAVVDSVAPVVVCVSSVDRLRKQERSWVLAWLCELPQARADVSVIFTDSERTPELSWATDVHVGPLEVQAKLEFLSRFVSTNYAKQMIGADDSYAETKKVASRAVAGLGS